MTPDRRSFLRLTATTGATFAALAARGQTPAPPVLSEKDPQAVALGYVSDAKRADKAKFPKYAEGQRCAACSFYQAAASAPMGPCALFAGRQVAGPGWCSAYVPKAA